MKLLFNILNIFILILYYSEIKQIESIHIKHIKYNIKHCDPLNKSTYVIPDADNCTVGYGIDGDSYFFGPCYDIYSCFDYETKCMFADGRENYCLGIDSHFCSFCDSGEFVNYFQVECG